MSGLPPTIDSHTLPKTPADEWANDTTNALDSSHVSNRDPSIPHFASTGAQEQQLPGAFPRGADLSAPPTSEDTKRSVQGMVGTAKQYIPGQEDVQHAIQTASDTAKQYLPESVGSYLPGSPRNSSALPSKEVPGGSGVGVGSLPGHLSESSVAKLPEERAREGSLGSNVLAGSNSSALPSKEVSGGSGVGVGSLPGPNSEAGVAKLPQERANEGTLGPNAQGSGVLGSAQQYIPSTQGISDTAKKYVPQSMAGYLPGSATSKGYSLPSTETPSGSAGGVGSLPGTASEISVAKLPEERRQEVFPSHETDHERLGKSGGVGALPGGPNESGVALLPEERAHGEDEIMKSYSGGVKTHAPVTTTTNTLLGASGVTPETQSGVQPAGTGFGYADLGAASTRGAPAQKDTQRVGDTHPSTQPESKTQKAKEGVQEAKSKVASTLPGHSGETGAKSSSHAPDTSAARATSATTTSAPTVAAAAPTTTAPATATTTTSTNDKTSGHRASTGGAGTHHKAGFMDKMKGEAMVISGKLGKNEKKVEEGKHLMGKV